MAFIEVYLYSLHSIIRGSSYMLPCDDGNGRKKFHLIFPFKHVVKVPSKHSQLQRQKTQREQIWKNESVRTDAATGQAKRARDFTSITQKPKHHRNKASLSELQQMAVLKRYMSSKASQIGHRAKKNKKKKRLKTSQQLNMCHVQMEKSKSHYMMTGRFTSPR